MSRIMVRLLTGLVVPMLALGACGDDTADDLVLGGADPDTSGESDDESDDEDDDDGSSDSSDDASDAGDLSDDSSDELSDELDDFFTDEFSDFSDPFTDGFSSCGGSSGGGCAEFDAATDTAPPAGTPPPGPVDELDELWADCNSGDDIACDDLWFQSPVASVYEAFAATCGGREPDNPVGGACDGGIGDFDAGGTCGIEDTGGCREFDGDYTAFDPTTQPPGPVSGYDDLWIECGDGDLAACDDLWSQTPVDSVYEAYAASCGGRYDDGDLATLCELEG